MPWNPLIRRVCGPVLVVGILLAPLPAMPLLGQGTIAAAPVTFTDVSPTDPDYAAIEQVAAAGIIAGYPDGSFRPNQTVTRAEFAKMLALALGLTASSTPTPFSDVPAGSWFAPYVSAAYHAGLIDGETATLFDPSGTITREEGAVLVARAEHLNGTPPLTFSDSSEIDAWALASVEEAVAGGYITAFSGNTFAPRAGLTRAEAAVAIAVILTNSETPQVSWDAIGPESFSNFLTSASADAPGTGLQAAGKIGVTAVDPADPQTMYVGAAGGFGRGPATSTGVYKTVDGGKTWSPASLGITNAQINDIWIDPATPVTLLAATDGGIFRSTNGAQTWTSVSPQSTVGFAEVGGTLYAGMSSGVASSSDGGLHWTLVHPEGVPVSALSAVGQTLYVAAGGTIDSGPSSWQTIYTAAPGDFISWVVANPHNAANVVFVHCPPSPSGGCTREVTSSTNGGQSWSQLPIPTTYQISQFSAQSIAFDSVQPNTLYVGGNMVISVSTNDGATFTQFPVDADIWALQPVPGQSGTFIVDSDQGTYLVTQGGQTWTSLNGNLTTSILYNVSVVGSTLMASAQDYSPFTSFDGGSTWTSQAGNSPAFGEGGNVTIDPSNPQIILTMGLCCGLQESTDGGKTFAKVGNVPPSLYTQDPQGITTGPDGTIYVATADGVYESTDGGQSFHLSGWPIGQPSFIAFGTGPSAPIFVGTENVSGNAGYGNSGQLQYSLDGGATWQTADLGGANGYPMTLSVDPSNPSDVLLGMSLGPQHGGGVLLSTDGGKTFHPASQGLADMSRYTSGESLPAIWQVSFEPNGALALAATMNGLYEWTSSSDRWRSVQGNALTNAFTGIAWSGATVYVSTLGEGVIDAPLSDFGQ